LPRAGNIKEHFLNPLIIVIPQQRRSPEKRVYVRCVEETDQTRVGWNVLEIRIMQIPAIVFHRRYDSLENLTTRYVLERHRKERRQLAFGRHRKPSRWQSTTDFVGNFTRTIYPSQSPQFPKSLRFYRFQTGS
jgi:hypothetical protein